MKENHSLLSIISHHILDSKPYLSILHLDITKHVIILWISCLIVFFTLLYISKRGPKTKLFTLIELIISFIKKDIIYQNFPPKEVNKWTSFFVPLFLFILTSNLLGMIPFSATITGNISVNIILASFTLFLTLIYGIKKKGFFNYFIGLVPQGTPKFISPVLFVIELVSVFSKPMPLFIRLFANMIGGHIMIIVFLHLIISAIGNFSQWFVVPLSILTVVAISIFEIFVCLLQAYIFTLLSAIFIGSAGEKH